MRAILTEVPIVEIDNALRALVYAGVSVGSLDCIVYGVLDAISEGVITRWDFDVRDITHLQKTKQGKTLLPVNWHPSTDWMAHEKRAILYGIIGCYRSMCHRIVEDFVLRFSKAQDFSEVRALKKEAFACGVLIDSDIGVQNNHNIVDSQKVFLVYYGVIDRLKKKENSKLWPILNDELESDFHFAR